MGTPKTLSEAIRNGLNESKAESKWATDDVAVIRGHVVDFVRQRFGAAMLNSPEAGIVLTDLITAIEALK